MNILCVASVENRDNVLKQISKQTVFPTSVFIHLDEKPSKHINLRRKRIAENQKILVDKIKELKPDLVWQLEDDVDLPENALEQLLDDWHKLKGVAYVSGIQVGRHGLYCLGAWRGFTDVSFQSLDYRLKGLQEVEATGLYCALGRPEAWTDYDISWNNEPYGPDVVWGRNLNKDYKIYCDMEVKVGHIIKSGIIRPEHPSTVNARFYKEGDNWKYKCD